MFRVLYVIPSLTTSGETHQLMTLVRRLRLRGVEVHVCVLSVMPPAAVRKLTEMGAVVHECVARGRFSPFHDRRLKKIVAPFRPGIIHCWETPAAFPLCMTARMKKIGAAWGAKIVSTVRRTDPFYDWAGVYPAGLVDADVLAANNTAVRAFYEKIGVAGNWRVVPDGVEPGDFPPQTPETRAAARRELRKTLKLPESAVLVGCVGPIRPEKRWKWAVWSVDSIVRIYPESHLLFLGNDAEIQRRTLVPADGNNGRVFPQRGRLETFARQYERSEIVHFLAERQDVADILPHLDLLWAPQSVFGSSVSLIQAALAGVPIVATETEGIHEILPPGTARFVPPYGETLQIASESSRLLEHSEAATCQTSAARAFALQNLTAEKMADAYLAIYEELTIIN